MKKWLNILSWVLLSGGFLIMWSFTMAKQGEMTCNQLFVKVHIHQGMTFISKEDVEVRLRAARLDPTGIKFSSIDLGAVEDNVREMKEVKKVKAFKTIDGNVHIDVTQRKPLIRIMNANGSQFYLDEGGFQMPVSTAYTARVPVVTGFLHEPPGDISAIEIGKSEVLKDQLLSDDIFRMVNYIQKSEFWNAQIQEIYVNRHKEFEFVPTMGDHRILFGSIDNMEGKFAKLLVFYEDGLRNMNWNRFSTINVKFKNQIVCTKK
ncbi:MAG: cell division protein FtsQ/DivIB [Flavobacteriales bacterium]